MNTAEEYVAELNRLADNATTKLKALEDRLSNLSPGVTVSVMVQLPDDGFTFSYMKLNSTWRLVADGVPICSCNRSIRIAAAKSIPAFEAKLTDTLQCMLASIKEESR